MTNRIMAVNFRGDDIYGYRLRGIVYVALKPIVEAIGLGWHGQFERVKRDPILAEGIRMIRIPLHNGGPQDALCLRLDLLNGWLFKIDSRRVKEAEVRQKVMVYQRECYGVLFKHFSQMDKNATNDNDDENLSLHLRMVAEARQIYGVVIAARLWKKLGLPSVPGMDGAWSQLDFFDRLEQRAAA